MSDPDGGAKQRDREVAQNESARQAESDVRVSSWAIIVTVLCGLAALGIVYAWLNR